MYSELKHIVKKNKLDNEIVKSSNKVLLVDRFSLDLTIKKCLIAKFLNKKYNLEPVLVHEHRENSSKLNIYKYFKVNNLKKINTIKNFIIYFFQCFYLTLHSIIGISINGFSWFINEFSIKGVKVGDLFYDSYIRYNLNFSKRNQKSIFFFKTIFFLCSKFLYLYDFLKKNNVKICIVGQHSYANSSTILFRICETKYKNIKFFITSGQEFLYYKYPKKGLYRLPFSIRPEYLKNLNFFDKKIIKKYRKHLNLRKKGKIRQNHDNANANYKKKMFSKNQILKKLKVKKSEKFDHIILFAAHVFADGPHGDGKLLYDDYYQHFTESVEKMKENKNVLYILKSHPSSFLLNEEGVLENYYYKNGFNKYKNIKVCPKDIKTNALLSFVDTVATCSGSAGLELAALYGKRPILAGASYYSTLGFTQDCKTKKEFYKFLANPSLIKKLSHKDKINANKSLYLVECATKVGNIGNFFPKNIRVYKYKKISVISDKNYIKELKKNSKKFKIESDPYYINLENVIKYGLSKRLSKKYKPDL
tara:strand:- start:8792 stop:10390 length:1599 start_codon:yes stop_codon:yes gene_type:complete